MYQRVSAGVVSLEEPRVGPDTPRGGKAKKERQIATKQGQPRPQTGKYRRRKKGRGGKIQLATGGREEKASERHSASRVTGEKSTCPISKESPQGPSVERNTRIQGEGSVIPAQKRLLTVTGRRRAVPLGQTMKTRKKEQCRGIKEG